MGMLIGYLEIVEVKKIRSRAVCQLIVEADISEFKTLVKLDEMTGIFIPCKIDNAICGAREMDIEPDELEALISATVTPADEQIEKPKKDKGRSLAQRMMVGGYFRNKELWAAMEAAGVYTQSEHKGFVESLEGINAYKHVPRKGDVVAHHVRTSANSGKGMKPPHWYCIPLHDSQHQYLHNNATRAEREQHLEWAVGITEKAMREAFKRFERIESMTGYTEASLITAENRLGITSPFTIDIRKSLGAIMRMKSLYAFHRFTIARFAHRSLRVMRGLAMAVVSIRNNRSKPSLRGL